MTFSHFGCFMAYISANFGQRIAEFAISRHMLSTAMEKEAPKVPRAIRANPRPRATARRQMLSLPPLFSHSLIYPVCLMMVVMHIWCKPFVMQCPWRPICVACPVYSALSGVPQYLRTRSCHARVAFLWCPSLPYPGSLEMWDSHPSRPRYSSHNLQALWDLVRARIRRLSAHSCFMKALTKASSGHSMVHPAWICWSRS